MTTTARPYAVRRWTLAALWALHGALWLGIAVFPLLLRRWLYAEAETLGLGTDPVVDELFAEQAAPLVRVLVLAILLCVSLALMAGQWAWHLAARKRWAWLWSSAWLGLEVVCMCAGLRSILDLPSSAPMTERNSPVDAYEPVFVGLILAQLFLGGVLPFAQIWARRAFAAPPGGLSDGAQIRAWLAQQRAWLLMIIVRVRRRLAPPPPAAVPQAPTPPPIDVERRALWATRPLPPGEPAPDQPPAPPGDGYLRS